MTGVYQSRHIKKPRQRATRVEVIERKVALRGIVRAAQPATVRQVFYLASVRGIVEKDEAGYNKVQRDLVAMRRAGVLPFHWITDNTRWQIKPDTYDNINEALEETAALYRRNLWRSAPAHVEIWLEKDALSGVVLPVTEEFTVPLMVRRGYSSLTFLHSAAEAIAAQRRPTFIFHLGDHDPSGVDAADKIEKTLRELAPAARIVFERLAVTTTQIRDWGLPGRPTKKSDSRAKKFGHAQSVELDAIPPDKLRALVRDAIEQHMPAREMAVLRVAEDSERRILMDIANRDWAGGAQQGGAP